MSDQTITVRRGGSTYVATWRLTQGYVRVLSPFGMAEGKAGADPEATATALMNKVLEIYERSPR